MLSVFAGRGLAGFKNLLFISFLMNIHLLLLSLVYTVLFLQLFAKGSELQKKEILHFQLN